MFHKEVEANVWKLLRNIRFVIWNTHHFILHQKTKKVFSMCLLEKIDGLTYIVVIYHTHKT